MICMTYILLWADAADNIERRSMLMQFTGILALGVGDALASTTVVAFIVMVVLTEEIGLHSWEADGDTSMVAHHIEIFGRQRGVRIVDHFLCMDPTTVWTSGTLLGMPLLLCTLSSTTKFCHAVDDTIRCGCWIVICT
jgi:hypothetical protein